MLYKHTGLPEEEEIVLCKVTKIFPNSVFVELVEYGESGMIHISEVSPGRIRNLREFVSLDRQIVCKVLRIDQQRGHIDLSLRRVNSTDRQAKLEEIKQELKAEQLVKNLATKLKRPLPELYAEIKEPLFHKYSHLYPCFREVALGEANLGALGIKKQLADELTAAIQEKFKPLKVTLSGEIHLQTYHSDGVERIRGTLLKISQLTSSFQLTYLGGGRYKYTLEAPNYKPAEKHLQVMDEIIARFPDKLSIATHTRGKA